MPDFCVLAQRRYHIHCMILCLGTTPCVQHTMSFERLMMNSVNRAAEVHRFASGKSVNVARVLKSLGENVIATGFVGGAEAGYISADLARSQIPHDFVIVEVETRMCITVLDQSQGTATELVQEPLSLPQSDYHRLLQKLKELTPDASALVLSGTLPPNASTHFYADCIDRAGSAIPIILDARGAALLAALPRKPMIVKLNREELSQTAGTLTDDEPAIRSAMRIVIERGARWVIVTAGSEPTLVSDGTSDWRVVTPAIPAVNPIGSGDAFAAGLAAELVRGKDLPGACVLAAACGAANAMTMHAGHLRVDDVHRLSKTVRIETIH